MNAVWHDAHPMPPRATLAQRVDWHVAHARACECRPMPADVVAELTRRRASAAGRRIVKKR